MAGGFLHLIRNMRQAAGISQAALAARLETTQSAVARWERGDVSPRLDTVQRIAQACGLEVHIVWSQTGDVDLGQIQRHLSWTPEQRLDNLLQMLAFEEVAHRARLIGPAQQQNSTT